VQAEEKNNIDKPKEMFISNIINDLIFKENTVAIYFIRYKVTVY
jgi:hypothetical protein